MDGLVIMTAPGFDGSAGFMLVTVPVRSVVFGT